MKKWKRSLGTSKREQGVETPKAPQNRGATKLTFFGAIKARYLGWFSFIVKEKPKYKRKKSFERQAVSQQMKTTKFVPKIRKARTGS